MCFVRAYCFTYYPRFGDACAKKFTLNRLARSDPSGHFYSVAMSNLVKYCDPLSASEISLIIGIGCLILLMAVLAAFMSMQILILPAFFGTATIGETQSVCSLSGTFPMMSCDVLKSETHVFHRGAELAPIVASGSKGGSCVIIPAILVASVLTCLYLEFRLENHAICQKNRTQLIIIIICDYNNNSRSLEGGSYL